MPKPAELQLTPGKPMRWMMARSFLRREEVKGALFFSLSHSNHHPQQFDEKKETIFFRQITRVDFTLSTFCLI